MLDRGRATVNRKHAAALCLPIAKAEANRPLPLWRHCRTARRPRRRASACSSAASTAASRRCAWSPMQSSARSLRRGVSDRQLFGLPPPEGSHVGSSTARCWNTPEATVLGPWLLSRNTGSATPPGRGRDKRRPTSWATAASMMLRDARPLAGGATECAWASTEHAGWSLLLYLAERQRGRPGVRARHVDAWPPGAMSSRPRSVRSLVVVRTSCVGRHDCVRRRTTVSGRSPASASISASPADSTVSSARPCPLLKIVPSRRLGRRR